MRRVPGLDVVVAFALTAFMVLVSVAGRVDQPYARPVSASGIVLLVLAGIAFAVRRVVARTSFVLVTGCVVAYLALDFAGWAVYVAAVASLIGLIFAVPQRRRWVPAVTVAGLAISVATGRPEGWDAARMLTIAAVWAAIAIFAWRMAEIRRRQIERDAAAQVLDERLRIARDLHDLLSHSLATVSLRAAVGLHLLDQQPDQAREALQAIRITSNDALAQARATLSLVRGEQSPPTPSLSDLDALVRSVREAGVTVHLDARVADEAVPSAVGQTAYRVAQEALTNVLRHAGASATARVRVQVVHDQLEIDVTDDGVSSGGASSDKVRSPGHGLSGMAERVAAVGGSLQTGPESSGFAVRARLPLAVGR
ncbi:sensor histidine kinase [Hamadaea sp. NPDC050747]|uniref:sensor histidine kinase n=1 Tax=Hamadaea sp. NPDC050747 TaxID=3155789 RepID=UPI0033C482BA